MPIPQDIIRLNVIEQLKSDPRVDDTNIVVTVLGGTVTLSGNVPSYRSREFAIMDALKIEGVAYLENKLVVNRGHI